MILRFGICIPTYNNPKTLASVVQDCLKNTPYPIWVIDDGSTEPVCLNGLISELTDQTQYSRLHLIRFDTNQGKGAALQRGFNALIENNLTHMIALDADGQHLAHEILKLTPISIQNPWDLVIGSRKMQSENVPEISKFGRKFSNFWVKFQTSQPVSDSQSGFRIYPLFQVQCLKFWTRKFDFEIEVLIRLLWRGVGVHEIEIDCHYPRSEDRVSHFHKFRDNFRISLLNTVLVVLSLLRSHHKPRDIGFAVGVGVWVGTTPLFGLHTLIIGLLAFVFRLNAVYLWLGTQISIPPLAPLLAIVSIALGNLVTKKSGTSASGFSWNWMLGSLVFGLGLGLTLGFGAYLIAKRIQLKSQNKKAQWNGKARGGKFGNSFLKLVIKLGGIKVAYALLFLIVPYFYVFAPKARRSANQYWSIARPDVSIIKRQWLVLKQLYRFGQTLLDRVYQSFHQELCFKLNSSGISNILDPIVAEKGLIVVTAHAGNWDIAAHCLKSKGLGQPLYVVRYESQGITFEKATAQAEPGHLKKIVANLQTSQGGQPILAVRELLARGLPVALMGDRPLGNHYELVLFFNKLAPFDCTPFRIASVCQVPLLYTFGFKRNQSEYDFSALPPQHYPTLSGREKSFKMVDWAQDYAHKLEQMLKNYPEQWFNFFDFWSAIPLPPDAKPSQQARNHSKEELGLPTVEKAGWQSARATPKTQTNL